MKALNQLKKIAPDLRVVIVTRKDNIAGAIRAAKAGAHDYLSARAAIDDIVLSLTHAKLPQPEPRLQRPQYQTSFIGPRQRGFEPLLRKGTLALGPWAPHPPARSSPTPGPRVLRAGSSGAASGRCAAPSRRGWPGAARRKAASGAGRPKACCRAGGWRPWR